MDTNAVKKPGALRTRHPATTGSAPRNPLAFSSSRSRASAAVAAPTTARPGAVDRRRRATFSKTTRVDAVATCRCPHGSAWPPATTTLFTDDKTARRRQALLGSAPRRLPRRRRHRRHSPPVWRASGRESGGGVHLRGEGGTLGALGGGRCAASRGGGGGGCAKIEAAASLCTSGCCYLCSFLLASARLVCRTVASSSDVRGLLSHHLCVLPF